MTQSDAKSRLEQIPVHLIDPNKENPRLAFRQGELDELQESIRVYGIQVPLAVFRNGSRYVLIDGERRWRCASKLNLKTVPAIVQAKPSPLNNLLMMFNIHSLREQWDLLTIAMKLPTVIALLKEQLGKTPTEPELSLATGLARSVIRRSKLLMELPQKYHSLLLEELKKPKTQQRISEDFFIEMEKALRSAEKAMPGIIPDRDKARQILLKKYRGGVIKNLVDLRKIPKIARAEKIGADLDAAQDALTKLFQDNKVSIEDAFTRSVSGFYAERDIASRIEGLIDRLQSIGNGDLDEDIRDRLEELVKRAQQLLEVDE